MPHYRAPDGTRFYFDAVPEPGTVRGDLIEMTDAEVAEADAPRVIVPEAVDMAQARLALLGIGITADMVEAEIAKFPSPQRGAALIEWNFRPRVRRESPLVAALGPALGLTEQQIDDLFVAAAEL